MSFGQSSPPSDALHRAVNEFRKIPLFTIVLSTNGFFRKAPAPLPLPSSTCVERGMVRWYRPFVAIGLDQLAQPAEKHWILEDYCKTNYIVTLGRPLYVDHPPALTALTFLSRALRFASRFNCGTNDVAKNIVAFAIEKLIGAGSFSSKILYADAKAACIAVRIPLDIQPRNFDLPAYSIDQESQVINHMRIVLSIDPIQGTSVTIAPSEPILVEAAACCWHERAYRFDPVATLASFVNEGSVSDKDHGELFAMLLDLLAHDAAAAALGKQTGFETYHKPVLFLAYLRSLFAEDHHETVMSARNAKGTVLSDYFANAYVNFTHFVKVDDDKMITAKFLAMCMTRNFAILCADQQLGVDLVIPISMDGIVRASSMSALKQQVKNYSSGAKYKEFDVFVHDSFLRSEDLDEFMGLEHPSVNMLINFGAEPSVQVERTTPRQATEAPARRDLSGLNLFVGGHSPDIYQCINASQETAIEILLRRTASSSHMSAEGYKLWC